MLKLHFFSNTTATKLTDRNITHLCFLGCIVEKNILNASSIVLLYETQPDKPSSISFNNILAYKILLFLSKNDSFFTML